MSENKLYLSKRNLLTLLSKLERYETGQETNCAIIKYSTHLDPYCLDLQGETDIMVIAIPDEKYYTTRDPGEVHPLDTPK